MITLLLLYLEIILEPVVTNTYIKVTSFRGLCFFGNK